MYRSVLFVLLLCVATADIYSEVQKDSQAGIKTELEGGADINQIQPGSGQTPLMNAVLSGKLQAVKYLLRKGADFTIGEKDGYTPMHGAGFQGRSEIAKVLHAAGVPIDAEHPDGHFPLARACWGSEQRHTDTVQAMLELGASLKGDEADTTRREESKQVILDFMAKNKEDL